MASKCITVDNVNPRLKLVKNAFLGTLAARAEEIEKQLSSGKFNFTKIIRANSADIHATGQSPMTHVRQILSMILYPPLIEDSQFTDDIKKRARHILNACRGQSIGSYTEASGAEPIRRDVASFINKRDKVPANWQDIYLCSGVADGLRKVVKLFVNNINGKKAGILLPVPRNPMYSSMFTEYNIKQVNYYFDESKNWSFDLCRLEKAIEDGKKTCNPKVLVIINPGNPTGQVLSKDTIEGIIKIAYKEKLFLLADEVYQDYVYNDKTKFISFKKVITEMGSPFAEMPLASFMSSSKSFIGECGARGGYIELINISDQIRALFLKSLTAMLCPTMLGQAVVDCMVNPPEPGEPSYDLYLKEKANLYQSMKDKSKIAENILNSLEGIHSHAINSSMFAYPSIQFSPKARDAAVTAGLTPDGFYAMNLLEKTGIYVIPGSEFGECEGSYHFGFSIALQKEVFVDLFERFSKFHKEFIQQYM